MTTVTFPIRAFGGRKLQVSYDGTALSIANQSLTVSTLSSALQTLWSDAIVSAGIQTEGIAVASGDNISAAIGTILDQTPTWRTSVQAAIASLQDSIA
jgi:hypothetical protein